MKMKCLHFKIIELSGFILIIQDITVVIIKVNLYLILNLSIIIHLYYQFSIY